jgi:hypothetical protein
MISHAELDRFFEQLVATVQAKARESGAKRGHSFSSVPCLTAI